VRRFSPYAVGSAAALVGSGVALLVIHRVGLGVLADTTWGHIVLAKLDGARAGSASRPGHAPVDGPTTTAVPAPRRSGRALGGRRLAAVLVALPDPEPAVVFAAPGLARVAVAKATCRSSSSPRPGRGALLYVGAPTARSRSPDDRTGQVWHPRNAASVTRVALDRAQASLTVRRGGRAVRLALPAVAASPLRTDPVTDSPRAAIDFALGRALAGSAQPLTRTAGRPHRGKQRMPSAARQPRRRDRRSPRAAWFRRAACRRVR